MLFRSAFAVFADLADMFERRRLDENCQGELSALRIATFESLDDLVDPMDVLRAWRVVDAEQGFDDQTLEDCNPEALPCGALCRGDGGHPGAALIGQLGDDPLLVLLAEEPQGPLVVVFPDIGDRKSVV